MLFDNKELLEVAYVTKPHGLKGHLSIKVFEDFSDSIFKEDIPVFLDIEGMPVPFFIEGIKNSGNNFIIKFRYIDSGEIANRYKSCPVFVFAGDIEETPEEYYEPDFEFYDYEVFDKKYGYIGKIQNVNMIPGNPVFETNFKGKAIIIPYTEDFIYNIDHDKKRIDINTPDGLIELYL